MTEEGKELALLEETRPVSIFSDISRFEDYQRMAKLLASSDIVPKRYQGNVANAVIALELAQRIGASPIAVMQASYVVHGQPSWSSQFIIGVINASGRFSQLRYKVTGSGDSLSCMAYATDNRTGEVLEGPVVTMDMAKREGWLQKAGSKWQTMPELMIRYRAATFFGRLYAADLLMGMHTVDEVIDGGTDSISQAEEDVTVDSLNERFSTKDKDGKGKKSKKNGPEKVIKKFKQEIDSITNHVHLDRWRQKHYKRICRELPDKKDQSVVHEYAERRSKELLNDPPEPPDEPVSMISCPAGKGRVPKTYCNSECKSRVGCPAHDDRGVDRQSKLRMNI